MNVNQTIDERVVEMRFDNKQFEEETARSMSTLDKLKEKLNFKGATKGLEEISVVSRKIDFSAMGNAIENLRVKFSALQIVGISALNNITETAINSGKRLVKSLSTDNIVSGWNKLQQKANSMSTLISQGYETDIVEKQLEKLNWFSDETSYNFTDMIDNISKFTATGQKLEPSVTAMEGIALWAAKSGQNAQKASAAMYQLSQALGSGVMRKEDWKSIQNASMDTDEFRQIALDTAVSLGKLKKTGEDTYVSLKASTTNGAKAFKKSQFADSLTEGLWFDTDVMMAVYKSYSKGAEQVKKIIDKMDTKHGTELIASDVIQAFDSFNSSSKDFKKFLKDNGITGKAAEDLKKMVSELDKFGMGALKAGQEYRTFNDVLDSTKDAVSTKWMGIFERLLGNIDQQKELWSTIGDQFYEWFAEPLNVIDSKLAKWAKKGGRDDLFASFTNVWKYLESVIKPIKKAFNNIFPSVTVKQLVSITSALKDFTSKLKLSKEHSGYLKDTFKGIFSLFDLVRKIITSVAKAIFGFTQSEGIGSFIDMVLKAAAAIGRFFTSLNEGFDANGLSGVFESISSTLSGFLKIISDKLVGVGQILPKIGNGIANFANTVWNALKKLFSFLSENVSLGDIFAGLAGGGIATAATQFAGLIKKIKSALDGLFGKKGTKEKTGGIKEKFSDILGSVKESIQQFTSGIKIASLVSIAVAIGILSMALKSLAQLKLADISKGLLAIGIMLGMLCKSFKVLVESIKDVKTGDMIKTAFALILIAEAIKILSKAIVTIGSMSLSGVAKGLLGVGGALIELSVAAKIIDKVKIPVSTAVSMIALALACKIVAGALTEMGSMSWSEIGRGLTAMGVALLELAGITALLAYCGGAAGIVGAISILILTKTLKDVAESLREFGSMSWTTIGHGLVAMGVALAELGAVASLLGVFGAFSILGALGVLILTKTLKDIAEGLKEFGSMTWGEIARGLVGMGIALKELESAVHHFGVISGAGAILNATAMLILIQGLKKLAEAMKEFGSMKLSAILKGSIAMSKALKHIKKAVKTSNIDKGEAQILGSGSILILIQGLKKLVEAMKEFGSMKLGQILKSSMMLGKALKHLKRAVKTSSLDKGEAQILGSASILILIQGLKKLAEAMKEFGSIKLSAILKGSIAMGKALKHLKKAVKTADLDKGKAQIAGAASMLILVQGLRKVAEVMQVFGSMKLGQIIKGLTNMGIALKELKHSVSGGILGGIGKVLGASALTKVIDSLDSLYDALFKFGSMDWETIKNGLAAMGGALGETALGGILNTFSGLGANSIEKMSSSLGVLAGSVQKWSGIKVPKNLGSNLERLAEAIMELTFSGWGSNSISTVATPLGNLADSVSKWSKVKVPEGLSDQFSSLASAISEFLFTGLATNSIEKISGPLGTFADSLAKLSQVEINSKNWKTKLTNLASGLSAFYGLFVSGWSLSALSSPLETFADALTKLSKVKINSENWKTKLTNLASGLSAFYGLFVSGWSLSALSSPLEKLADALTKLSQVKIDTGSWKTKLTNLAEGVKAFSPNVFKGFTLEMVANSLSVLATAVKKFSLYKIPEDIGTELTSLSTAISDFATNTKSAFQDFDSKKANNFTASLDKLYSSVSAVKEIDTKAIKTFITYVKKLGNIKVDEETLSNSTSAISSSVRELMDAINSIILDGQSTVQTSTETAFEGMVSGIDGTKDDAKKATTSLIDKMIKVVKNKGDEVKKAFNALVSPAISGINSDQNIGDMVRAGGYLADGLIRGINVKKVQVYAAGYALGQAAVLGEKDGQNSDSPSKETIKAGKWLGEGLIIGIDKMSKAVYNSGYGMGDSAVKSISSSISKIPDLLHEDIDIQPTIRPVLDLSNVRSGAGAISDLLGSNVGILNNARSISAMRSMNQNGANNDIIKAIKGLRSDINNLPRETYQINGVTYDDGSNISEAVKTLVRAARVERRA